MKVIEKAINELAEYENNPRKNESAVQYVANSIKEFGFLVPVVIDKNDVIVAGHTRVKAARQLGLERVPCVLAEGLTEEQIRAFRLADNKTAEIALWDWNKLAEEMSFFEDISMGDFGFRDIASIDWANVDDLSEDAKPDPTKEEYECPACHHIAGKAFFKRVRK